MDLGAPYPMVVQWTADEIRRFACDMDACGIDFVTTSGHVLSSAPGAYPEKPPRVYAGPYHDGVVLFAHLSALTQRLRFRTSILILPLYATAMFATAVAELCDLSGDRFELGVGISWNEIEYRAAAQDVHRRGRRLDEQLSVLAAMWADERVTFAGEFHTITEMGVGRLPARRPPLWLGGTLNERNLARIVAHADGWIPSGDPTPHLDVLRDALVAAGRDPNRFWVNARLDLTTLEDAALVDEAERLSGEGVTHLVLDPGDGPSAPEAAARIAEAAATLAPVTQEVHR